MIFRKSPVASPYSCGKRRARVKYETLLRFLDFIDRLTDYHGRQHDVPRGDNVRCGS